MRASPHFDAIDFIWQWFKKRRDWPSRRDLLVAVEERSGSAEEVLKEMEDDLWIVDDGSQRKYGLRLEALVRHEEAKTVLAPLPTLLHLAMERYLEAPVSYSDTAGGPTITLDDMVKVWGDREAAVLAARAITASNGHRIGAYDDGTGFRLDLDVRCLRFPLIQSLDDLLVSPPPSRPIKDPTQTHIQLIRRIFSYVERNGRWPTSLDFSIENRALGYVPALVDELHPRFLRYKFQETQWNRLRLVPTCLPYLNFGEADEQAFLGVVKAASMHWRHAEPGAMLTVNGAAKQLQVPPERVLPWALLLEEEPWARGGNPGNEGAPWGIHVDEEVRRYASASTLETYLKLREENSPQTITFDLSTETVEDVWSNERASGEAPTAGDFAFIGDPTIRQVLERNAAELRHALDGRLHTASLVLIGALLEGLLVNLLQQNATAGAVPGREHDPSVIEKWPLKRCIDEATKLRLLPTTLSRFTDVLREFRNMIHPYQQVREGLTPGPESIGPSLSVLGALLDHLRRSSQSSAS